MEPIIIVSNDRITVEYLPDHKTIYHTVHKPIHGEALREVMYAGADYLEQNGVTKWLSDDRKNGAIPEEDAAWGKEWNQHMIDCGWKYWANVIPAELHAAGSLQPAIEDLYARGLRMNVFTSVEQALEWLDKME